jgi:hypothetical protein
MIRHAVQNEKKNGKDINKCKNRDSVQRVSPRGRRRTLKYRNECFQQQQQQPYRPTLKPLLLWADLCKQQRRFVKGVVIVRFGDPVACLLHAMLNVEEGWDDGGSLPVAGVKSDDEDWFDVVRGGLE